MAALERRFLTLGAWSGLLAVAAGAFGAHALRSRLDPGMREAFETAARYQMYHALALVAAAWACARWPGPAATAAGWSFVLGTVLFSGSLYGMALTGHRALGIVTPFGGVALLVGWLALALAARRGS